MHSEDTPDDADSVSAPRRIAIHCSNGNAFVWSIDDVAALRGKHRICGVLTGTLPYAAQQNAFLGLPLSLMPEEVVLLLKMQAAVIIGDISSYRDPTPNELEVWNSERRAAVTRASAVTAAPRAPALNDAANKKRLERQARRAALEHDTQSPLPIASSKGTTIIEPDPLKDGYVLSIPATSSDFSWYKPTTYETLESARAAGVWTFPNTIEERAKQAVFEGLWRQGYYLGNGLRFGGDWLVYPGDPLRFHSHFVASVLPKPTSTLQPMQIVAYGRLGTATKKAHLICGWDEGTDTVSYFTIEWAGFG